MLSVPRQNDGFVLVQILYLPCRALKLSVLQPEFGFHLTENFLVHIHQIVGSMLSQQRHLGPQYLLRFLQLSCVLLHHLPHAQTQVLIFLKTLFP